LLGNNIPAIYILSLLQKKLNMYKEKAMLNQKKKVFNVAIVRLSFGAESIRKGELGKLQFLRGSH